MERLPVGSVQQHIFLKKPGSLSSLRFPAAKRAVEIAIEHDEAEALAYLREHGAEP